MTKNSRDEREAVGTLGAFAIGGAGLASARALSGLLGEGRSSLSDLGPAPIGSDPWLLGEVRHAIAAEHGVDAKNVIVDVNEAVVTLRGNAPRADVPRVEAAARTVQGIKSLRVEIEAR